MTSYRLSPAARRDLEDIWDYSVQTWSAEQAERYITDIQAAIERLASGTIRGRSVDHVRKGYIAVGAGSHMVYCRRRDGVLEVIRILHQRMDVSRHIGKR